ncbi:MAG: prepilin peptidase [Gordonia sp. (in: high G+C Gram-positive bacteria)]|uniref:prepilin peptidase n=1 Tax=Gordonia sp. (in: high G+C Gram-positive bacteria) TaxID=84139 RepID=UPI003BB546D2
MGWGIALYLLLIADVDRRTLRIPNLLLLPLAVVAVSAAAQTPLAGVAALTAAAPYLLGFLRRACGGGDVKLATCCGALLGSPVAALVAVLLAAVIGLTDCVLAGTERRPHGPALVVATLAVLLLARR